MAHATTVVILNWNGAHFFADFLPGVVRTCEGLADVVVADNASSDVSVELLRRDFPSVRLLCMDTNHGFAQGYNLALRWVDQVLAPQFYVLLNSDVQVAEGWLSPLLDRLAQSPCNVACMPKLHAHHAPHFFEYAGAAGGYLDSLGYPYCRGRILGTLEEDTGQYDTPELVDWASGACLAIRAEAYWAAGGLCAGFFAHMEEIDLCWRLRRMGGNLWVEPRAEVLHVGGGALPNDSPRKLYLNYRNSLYMLRRNLPRRVCSILIFSRMCMDGLSAIVYLVQGQREKFLAVIRAHRDYWRTRRQYPHQPVVREFSEGGRTTRRPFRLIVWDYYVRRRRRFQDLP